MSNLFLCPVSEFQPDFSIIDPSYYYSQSELNAVLSSDNVALAVFDVSSSLHYCLSIVTAQENWDGYINSIPLITFKKNDYPNKIIKNFTTIDQNVMSFANIYALTLSRIGYNVHVLKNLIKNINQESTIINNCASEEFNPNTQITELEIVKIPNGLLDAFDLWVKINNKLPEYTKIKNKNCSDAIIQFARNKIHPSIFSVYMFRKIYTKMSFEQFCIGKYSKPPEKL